MITLTRLAFLLLLASLCFVKVSAQADTSSLIKVAPSGEEFSVLMPQQPTPKAIKKQFQSLSVAGKLYAVESAGVSFRVWSLKNQSASNSQSSSADDLLDACADLVWESLLKPERNQLSEQQARYAHMSYIGEHRLGAASGRDYSFVIGAQAGEVRFYITGNRIYILIVTNFSQDTQASQAFINSFTLAGMTANSDRFRGGGGIGVGMGGGIGPGRGSGAGTSGAGAGEIDYNRVFSSREVTQKARILAKPEAAYTESACKYGVVGTVILRAVLYATGEVTDIHVIKGLPHGLTRAAVEAAHRIKFMPAQVNGRAVSQYIQIEYNFNLY